MDLMGVNCSALLAEPIADMKRAWGRHYRRVRDEDFLARGRSVANHSAKMDDIQTSAVGTLYENNASALLQHQEFRRNASYDASLGV